MKFEQAILISATPADLFALTQDYGHRLDWDPFLKSATLLGGAMQADVGVRALCVAHSGLGMETVYVSYNPPRACAVKMTQGPKVIESFAGAWRFEAVENRLTRVGFTYSLRARPWWLSWLLTPIMGWVFARDTRKRLIALKKAGERGKVGQ